MSYVTCIWYHGFLFLKALINLCPSDSPSSSSSFPALRLACHQMPSSGITAATKEGEKSHWTMPNVLTCQHPRWLKLQDQAFSRWPNEQNLPGFMHFNNFTAIPQYHAILLFKKGYTGLCLSTNAPPNYGWHQVKWRQTRWKIIFPTFLGAMIGWGKVSRIALFFLRYGSTSS